MPLVRHCIIESSTGDVINAVEYESTPNPVPGFGDGYIAVPSATAEIGWHWNGSEFSNPNPSPPISVQTEPAVVIVAQARLVISGDEVGGIETAIGFAAALQIDTGVYWIFFTTPQPDIDYGVLPNARDGGGLFADVSDQTTDYVEITVTNRTGVPVNPTQLFISVQRTV